MKFSLISYRMRQSGPGSFSAGDGTEGLSFSRQALCLWATSITSPFIFFLLIRCLGWSGTLNPYTSASLVARITGIPLYWASHYKIMGNMKKKVETFSFQKEMTSFFMFFQEGLMKDKVVPTGLRLNPPFSWDVKTRILSGLLMTASHRPFCLPSLNLVKVMSSTPKPWTSVPTCSSLSPYPRLLLKTGNPGLTLHCLLNLAPTTSKLYNLVKD